MQTYEFPPENQDSPKPAANGTRLVAMFADARAKQPKPTSLGAILKAISAGRWREPVEAIRETYMATLAETGDTKRAKDAITEAKETVASFLH